MVAVRVLSVVGALGCLLLLSAGPARAAEYYVAPAGSDANVGTMAAPFATMQKGHDMAVAGDTVWLRGGTYKIVNGASSTTGVSLTKSGQSDAKRIRFFAVPGEVPVLDFSGLKITTSTNNSGINITGSWLHLKGLEIANVPMGTRSSNGIWNRGGSNNTFELLNIHHITGPGLSIANGNGGHLVLNCDSHDNYDPNSDQGDGQNADGFGVHYQESGPSTIIRGCRAWWNSDDGYDLISQEMPVTIENSWAMGNGYFNSGMSRPPSGNGNGFKAGSSKTAKRHIIRNCLAWKNAAAGFYANHSSGGNDWFNNTSYSNGTQYNMLASPPDDSSMTIILTGALAHKMRNNIGFPNKNTNMGGVDTMFNTWDLNVTPAVGDFASVTDTGHMGPRQADGGLPALDFMKLRAGSPMIDKGTNVMLPFAGTAPDLGAFEFGAVSGGSGGASGGTGGVGGSAMPGSGGRGVGGASGGASGSGGRAGTGGTVATGGVTASGGASVPGSGGVVGTGGAGTGSGGAGPISSGGSSGPSGSGGAAVGSGGQGVPIDGGAGSGCSCDAASSTAGATAGSLLLMLAALATTPFGRLRRRPLVATSDRTSKARGCS